MDKDELICEFPMMWAWPKLPVQVVWLTEYRTYGILLRESAHTATVKFRLGDEIVIEEVENDEYTYWHDHATEYERE